MITVTSEQWDLYLKKYSSLIWTISHRISGDAMTASLEDNYADLCIAALESIEGFHKKTGKSVDEMFGMKLFDQYTKTCLWNQKAKKGIKLSERMKFRRRHISIDSILSDTGEQFDIEDKYSMSGVARLEAVEILDKQDDSVKKITQAIKKNPTIVSASGNIKVSALSSEAGMTTYKVKKILNKLERKDELNQ